MPIEAEPVLGEVVEEGAGVPLIPVGAETIGAERVDEDEEEVDVVPRGDRTNVLDGPHRAGIPVFEVRGEGEVRRDGDDGDSDEGPGRHGLARFGHSRELYLFACRHATFA